MNYALILSQLLSTPWALMPEQLALVCGIVIRRQAGNPVSDAALAEVRATQEIRAARAQSNARAGNGTIAVIPVYGTIIQRAGIFDEVSGCTSTQMIGAQLQAAMQDDTVAGIVMDIDSPGGSVYGVSELGDQVRAIRGVKPIMGVSNSLCASAAYWIGSQCDSLYCTPGGEVGSIGVYGAHEDCSKMLEEAGIKMTLISAGKFKTEGNCYEPLSDDARAAMQNRIDQYYSAFTSAVAKGRNVPIAQVRDGMGQGRVLGAADAKDAGMIDDIDTLDGVIKRMTRNLRQPNSRASARRELEFLSA